MWWLDRAVDPIRVLCLLALLLPAVGATQETSPRAELERALQLEQAGESSQANSVLEAVVQQWPKYSLAHYHLGRLAFDRGELDLAETHLTAATAGQFPRVFSAWYYLGRVLLQAEKLPEAVAALDHAIELAPSFAPARLERGRARLALGDAEAGLDDLMRVLEIADAPHDARLRARRLARSFASEAESRDELWQALGTYEQLLDRLGSVPGIEQDVARVAQTMGATELASCAARRALKADAEDAALWYLLAAIEEDRGDIDAAIAACERSLALGNEDVRLWLKLGELYFEQMKISESIVAYQEAMAREPRAAEAVRSFALSSLTTEQYEALRQVLESHIEVYPENLNTLYSLGVMNLRDNRLEEAERYLLRLAQLAPDHRQVHYNLGQLYLRLGDTARGQAEMQRFAAIKEAENRDWEHHNQAHFRRVEARKAIEEGQLEAAIPLWEQSIAEGTAEVSDYLELAEAQLRLGAAGEAVARYEGVLSSFPYNRDALAGLLRAAAAAEDSGRQEDARRKLLILDWPCEVTDR